MILVLARLAQVLTILSAKLEDSAEGAVMIWEDDQRVYLDAVLDDDDDEGEESLDLSLQAGRLFLTASR